MNLRHLRARVRSVSYGIPVCVAAVLVTAATPALAQSARQLEKHGREAFASDAFEDAVNAFEEAATVAADGKLDPAVAHYNRALALSHLGRHQEAADGYVQSLRTTDLALQQPAYYNRGNALVAVAGEREAEDALQPAVEAAQEALVMYEKAMTLNPGDVSAKTNFELALQKLEDLESKLEQQQQNQQNEEESENQDEQEQEEQEDQESGDPQENEQNGEQDGQQDDQNQDQQQQQDGQQDDESPDNQPPPGQDPGEAQPRPSEEMTREEAEMLLDAIREEEQSARERIRVKFGAGGPVEKDW